MKLFKKMYDYHINEFHLGKNDYLPLFEKLLHESCFTFFECAPCVTPDAVHVGRFRLGTRNNTIQKGFETILMFLNKISKQDRVRLNDSILNHFTDKTIDTSSITGVAVGTDIRKNINDSKIKCYFELNQWSENMDAVISRYKLPYNIKDYMIDDLLMFGINMYFDGRTDVEFYHHIPFEAPEDCRQINRLNLTQALESFHTDFEKFGVSFDSHGNRILHFYSLDSYRFVRATNNRQLSLLYSNIQILKYLFSKSGVYQSLGAVFSFPEKDIISKNIQHMNLAYSLMAVHE